MQILELHHTVHHHLHHPESEESAKFEAWKLFKVTPNIPSVQCVVSAAACVRVTHGQCRWAGQRRAAAEAGLGWAPLHSMFNIGYTPLHHKLLAAERDYTLSMSMITKVSKKQLNIKL